MEVFNMVEYKTYEVDKYEAYKGYGPYNGNRSYVKSESWRSPKRQWDRIVHFVCTGCGKPLSRYETVNKLAFCLDCREVLFPETIGPKEALQRKVREVKRKGDYL